jgi:hypothetical protein
MTLDTLIVRLLTHFPHEERSIPDAAGFAGRNAAALTAVNGALQEIFAKTPWSRRGTEGFLFSAPATVTATVTAGSKVIDFDAAWLARFVGCTCRVGTSSQDNRIMAAGTGGGATLLFPHDGTTGSQSVTVYHDCSTLDATISDVLKPVRIQGGPFLTPRPSPASFVSAQTREKDYGFDRHAPLPTPASLSMDQVVGIPRLYCVEEHQTSQMAVPEKRLSIYPAPEQPTLISARIRYGAPIYDDPEEEAALPIPQDYVETILIPVAEQHLTRSQFFSNSDSKQAIADAYQDAIALMRTLNPQTSTGTNMRPVF